MLNAIDTIKCFITRKKEQFACFCTFILSTELSIVSLNKGGQEGEAIFTFLHVSLLQNFSVMCQHVKCILDSYENCILIGNKILP